MECEDETNINELEMTVLSGELEKEETTSPISDVDGGDKEVIKTIRSGNDALVASTDEGELLRWHYR